MAGAWHIPGFGFGGFSGWILDFPDWIFWLDTDSCSSRRARDGARHIWCILMNRLGPAATFPEVNFFLWESAGSVWVLTEVGPQGLWHQ